MGQEAGFRIGGVFYPAPRAYRLEDPVLVREVTGLSWDDFAELLDDAGVVADPVALVGVIAVAVWQPRREVHPNR
jgi:hypothetical protein